MPTHTISPQPARAERAAGGGSLSGRFRRFGTRSVSTTSAQLQSGVPGRVGAGAFHGPMWTQRS